jgi:hypothetical protein
MAAICETLRQPAPKNWLAVRVTALLSHSYVSDLEVPVGKIVASDWLDSLSIFPAWAVQEACTVWLRTQAKRPTIFGISELCQQSFGVVEYARQKAMRGPGLRPWEQAPAERPEVTEGDRAKRGAQIGDVLKKMQAKVEAGK